MNNFTSWRMTALLTKPLKALTDVQLTPSGVTWQDLDAMTEKREQKTRKKTIGAMLEKDCRLHH